MTEKDTAPPVLWKVFSSLAWTAGASWLQLALGLVTFAVITAKLTPAEVGIFGAGMFIAGLGLTLFTGPFADSLQQRDTIDRDHVDASFWTGLLTSLAVAGALAAFARPAASLLGADDGGPVLAMLCLMIPLGAAGAAPAAMLGRELRFADVARADSLASLVSSLVGIGAILAGFGVWSLVASEVARQFVRLVGILTLARYAPAWPKRFSAIRDLFRLNLAALAAHVLRYVDRLGPRAIVGAMLGATSLGYFVIADRLLEILHQLVLTPIASVTMASVARLRKDREALAGLMRKLFAASTLVGYPAFLGAIVALPLLAELAGERWRPAVLTAQILMLVGLRTATTVFYVSVLRGLGLSRAPLVLLGTGLALQLILAPLGAMTFGVAGVALAVLARTYAVWPLGAWFLKRETGLPLREQLAAGAASLAAGLVMLAAAVGVYFLTDGLPPLGRLAAVVGAGVAVYGPALLAFSPKMRRLIAVALAALGRAGPRAALRAVRSELGLSGEGGA